MSFLPRLMSSSQILVNVCLGLSLLSSSYFFCQYAGLIRQSRKERQHRQLENLEYTNDSTTNHTNESLNQSTNQ